MSTEEKSLLAVLTIAAVLLPAALGAAFGWPVWVWLLLAVLLLGVPVLVIQNIQRRAQRKRIRDTYAPPVQVEQPPPAQQTPVTEVALPSAVADYSFHFSATAYWRPTVRSTVQHANLSGLATDAIVARAQEIAAAEQPSRVDVLAHRLAGMLSTAQRDASNAVEAWAEDVRLTLPEADQARLRALADVRKDQEIWEHERDHERSKRAYLADDVLKSTGSAVVWWLTQKDNDVEGTVRLIGSLAQLSAAANDAGGPGPLHHLAPDSVLPHQLSIESLEGDQQFPSGPFPDARSAASRLGALMDALNFGDEQRALFAHRVALLVGKAGKPEHAQEIRRCFDAPAVDEIPAEVSEPDSEPGNRSAPDDGPAPPQQPGGETEQAGEPRV